MATILLLEEDPHNRLYYQVNLEVRGFRTVPAGALDEVAPLLDAIPPDAVLVSLSLLDAGGLELLTRLSQTPELSRLPVVVVLGLQLDEEQIRRQHTNVASVLVKPFPVDALVASVQRIAGQAGG